MNVKNHKQEQRVDRDVRQGHQISARDPHQAISVLLPLSPLLRGHQRRIEIL